MIFTVGLEFSGFKAFLFYCCLVADYRKFHRISVVISSIHIWTHLNTFIESGVTYCNFLCHILRSNNSLPLEISENAHYCFKRS